MIGLLEDHPLFVVLELGLDASQGVQVFVPLPKQGFYVGACQNGAARLPPIPLRRGARSLWFGLTRRCRACQLIALIGGSLVGMVPKPRCGPGLGASVGREGAPLAHAPCSSTISASTTSSSDGADPPGAPPSAEAEEDDCSYIRWAKPWLAETNRSVADLMASTSEPPRASFTALSSASTFSFSSPENLSPCSRSNFSVEYTKVSALLRTSASSRLLRSSSAWDSASRTMRSMSSLPSEDWPVMVIDCSLPVARSLAATCTIPLAARSRGPSFWGTPRGAGGRSTSWNLPSVLLYMAISRSPCRTWTSTDG